MRHPIASDGRWALAVSSNTPDDFGAMIFLGKLPTRIAKFLK